MNIHPNVHKIQPPLIDVEDVMSRVREVAKSGRNAAVSAPQALKGQNLIDHEGEAIRPPPNLVIKQHYYLAELLVPEDQLFLQHAYLCLLGRCCDKLGQKHYQKALQTGSLDKVEILGRLRYGSEGRKNRVHVTGLLIAFIWNTFARALSRIGLFLSGGIRHLFLS